WYCCGEASLSMAVSPFFALTLLDQSPGPRARTLSAVWYSLAYNKSPRNQATNAVLNIDQRLFGLLKK
ncbi:hypothetical protein LXE05_16590, partial [Yersinia enterocolitica]|nr:hypothetical protein [Yersinia enterocolitica]